MKTVRSANPMLESVEPYDAHNLDARVFLSANESPADIPEEVRDAILRRLSGFDFNRYPDPLANKLRAIVAPAFSVEPGNILFGNGGDELLFDLFMAYGGKGRKFLNLPPTFSIYAYNAYLTGTEEVCVPRRADFTVDEEAVLERVSKGDIDFVILTSPNNPTGDSARLGFIEELLDASDALVLVDEAYYEFSGQSALPSLWGNRNLLVLHTFSKAFSLASARIGYVIGDLAVIDELAKVRQAYSVDAISQIIAEEAFSRRELFQPEVDGIIARREKLYQALVSMDGVQVWPSTSNFMTIRVADAHEMWVRLFEDHSVLVRDFSSTPGLEDCLRVTVGSVDENAAFLAALQDELDRRR